MVHFLGRAPTSHRVTVWSHPAMSITATVLCCRVYHTNRALSTGCSRSSQPTNQPTSQPQNPNSLGVRPNPGPAAALASAGSSQSSTGPPLSPGRNRRTCTDRHAIGYVDKTIRRKWSLKTMRC